ncbi:MAG: DUF357 domain-containing protein [Methanobacteriaceae archaeon]|jgi:hypothetical protein|nr:DUF357 domain-containing protein [Candidatus Methanorudis spinitermitis]
MECRERILIDIDKLENSFKEIRDLNLSDKEKKIIERAKNYRDDCEYYLEKRDELSSFGCITYSHGLIDALKIKHNLI